MASRLSMLHSLLIMINIHINLFFSEKYKNNYETIQAIQVKHFTGIILIFFHLELIEN